MEVTRASTVQTRRAPDKASSALRRREALAGYLLIAPNMLFFVVWTLIPILFTLALAFSRWDFVTGLDGIQFIGLQNFFDMPGDRWFVDSLRNSFVFTAASVPLTMFFGLLFALLLNKAVYFPTLLRAMIFLPYITSAVAIGVVWMMIFHPTYGPLNTALYELGIHNPPRWLASSEWALVAIIIVMVWAGIGYDATIFLAGLQGIPDELQEAAAIDGANAFQRFRFVTFPLLSPTTFFLLITGVIASFKVFDTIAVMTQGGPGTSTSVLAYYMYTVGFVHYKMGYASAIAWVLMIIIAVFTLIQLRQQRRAHAGVYHD